MVAGNRFSQAPTCRAVIAAWLVIRHSWRIHEAGFSSTTGSDAAAKSYATRAKASSRWLMTVRRARISSPRESRGDGRRHRWT